MKLFNLTFLLFFLLFLGCIDTNKTVPAEINNLEPASGTLNIETPTDDIHTVMVNEVLPATKYVYLNVIEGDEKYWIATKSTEAKVGEMYYYKGRLLKTNFENKEYNRVFDKVYLVGSLVSANHGSTAKSETIGVGDYPKKEATPMHAEKIVQHEGSIKIAELIKNQKQYEGKTVQIDAKCTKINSGIMNRNWIHLKDGSKDDFDLVVTSDALIQVGSVVTIKAVVTLNKDFGAGYKYDLILEHGILIN